ncbi:uncharacterized protein G2W53_001304 [Senna tora]|uniref:Uncharacterized protein n=1 Tax=Senna tora TaxID=362788 RepID=A0A834XHE8_9FABA|nr:uncharacterized protein G2W53_001304 [Senna tora]
MEKKGNYKLRAFGLALGVLEVSVVRALVIKCVDLIK